MLTRFKKFGGSGNQPTPPDGAVPANATPLPATDKAAAALASISTAQTASRPEMPATPRMAALPTYTAIKVRLHHRLLEEINLSAIEKLEPDEFREQIGNLVRELLKAEKVQLNLREQQQVVGDVIDEMIGLGPLEPLLKDPSINDILVNTYKRTFIERACVLELTPVHFQDDKHLMRVIMKIVSRIGRRVDESQPMVDARLPDGSRVNVAIPPVAIDGPIVSIRKFAARPYTLESLIENNSLTVEIAEILRAIVRSKLNVLISGGTGSGKTTLLNAMSRYIDERERIVTIEDAAELQLQQMHVVRLETRPPSIEGKGEIRQRELVKNSLRMRPDRIIVGEVRAGEAFDMLQAMNTGHEGSMTTIHANTPRDALTRLEQMVGMAGLDIPTRSMRQQIASAIHVVVQLQRLSDGRRRIMSVAEITGMEGEVVQMQEIYKYTRKHVDPDGTIHGEFRATGIRPKFMEDMKTRGIDIPPQYFDPDRPLGQGAIRAAR
jgi:pilus assembly protein CpaF